MVASPVSGFRASRSSARKDRGLLLLALVWKRRSARCATSLRRFLAQLRRNEFRHVDRRACISAMSFAAFCRNPGPAPFFSPLTLPATWRRR